MSCVTQRLRLVASLGMAGGVAMFLVVVVSLHFVQPGYDPLNQLMSELAAGQGGDFLVLGFTGLSIATAGLAVSLLSHGAPIALAGLSVLAAASFAAAGLLPLQVSIGMHVLCVAMAFVACGLSMCLLPTRVEALSEPSQRVFSWGVFVFMLVVTALGGAGLPSGVSQRLAAAALLLWLLMVARRLSRRPEHCVGHDGSCPAQSRSCSDRHAPLPECRPQCSGQYPSPSTRAESVRHQ